MGRRYSKVRQSIAILGLIGIIFTGALGMTGCTPSELKEAQSNIDTAVTEQLNCEEIQAIEKELFSKYTFLCADVEKVDNSQYAVGINGVATRQESNQKAYTTINYVVSDSYFKDGVDAKKTHSVINKLAEIVKNENYESYSISNVKSLDALNEAMCDVTESPIKDFKPSSNFLYGVSEVNLSEDENVASFATKELIKFSKTSTETTIGIVGYGENGPEYGPVVRTVTDYESYFIDNIVYIKLTPEEMEQAKTDDSFVFEKFVEYVNKKDTSKYVVQQTNVADNKEFNANMRGNVSFREMDK